MRTTSLLKFLRLVETTLHLFLMFSAIASPISLIAQTNTNPPVFATQPQNQFVFANVTVFLSADAKNGGGQIAPLSNVTSGTLELWLRADAGVVTSNGSVSLWHDQSGNGNDAVQTNANAQPTLNFPSSIGGEPAIYFNGIQNSASSQFLHGVNNVNVPASMTSFLFYEVDNVTSKSYGGGPEQVPFCIGVPGYYGYARIDDIATGIMLFSTWAYSYSTSYSIPTNTYRVWTDRINLVSNTLRVSDDTLSFNTNFDTTPLAQNTPDNGYYVGGLDPSVASQIVTSRNLGGNVAEIITFAGALSDADCLAVKNYLLGKYYQVNGTNLSFQWLFNNSSLPGATNHFLTLTNIQPSQAGIYTLLASNAYGIVNSSNAVVAVDETPVILSQPTNLTVVSGQPALFSVSAVGPLPLQYQWNFNGSNLFGATNSSLMIKNVNSSNVGQYNVIVGTQPFVTGSSNAVLSIYAQNQIISNFNQVSLMNALLGGGTITFVSNGTILLTNTMFVSNNAVIDGGTNNVTVSGGGTVEIFNVIAGVNFALKNLTLANGMSNGFTNDYGFIEPLPGYGGAIFNNGSLDLENCVFSNNIAIGGNEGVSGSAEPNISGSGGAIFNSGSLTITNTLFVSNSAIGANGGDSGHYKSSGSGYGGAIYNAAGTITMGQVTFSNNSALGGSIASGVLGNTCGVGYGGAILSSGGILIGNNIAAFNNSSTGGGFPSASYSGSYITTGGAAEGGGFYLAGSYAAISNGIFSNNLAVGGSGNYSSSGVSAGGGIFNAGFTILAQCTVTSGRAQGGGVAYAGYSSTADGMGGGLYNSGTMQVLGSVLSNNVVSGGSPSFGPPPADGLGGAIYNAGSLGLQNTTLTANNSLGGATPGGVTTYGNAYGGGIANIGFIHMSGMILSNDFGIGKIDVTEIYNLGVIQSDANSFIVGNFTNSPPDTFQWQYNGTNISGANNDSFSLGNVQFGVSNSYALFVSNSNGSTTNLEILNLPPPLLALFSITPNVGLTNGGTIITITGTGFTNGATVYFGQMPASNVVVVNASSITAVTPASSMFGPINITVTNGDFQPIILTNGFTYLLLPQNLSAAASAGGSVQISFSGTPNSLYFLQSTTNLLPPIQWQTIATNNTDMNGNFVYQDTNVSITPARFYRAALP